jgi:hypothetical protein
MLALAVLRELGLKTADSVQIENAERNVRSAAAQALYRGVLRITRGQAGVEGMETPQQAVEPSSGLSFGGGRDPIYGPRLSNDLDALSSTIGWAPWMRLFRRWEQRLVNRRRAAREPQERATPAA